MDRADQGRRWGTVLIVSGPSGTGKTTVCRRLLEGLSAMRFSVSCTTREPRPDERDGVDYFFLQRPEFEQRVVSGEFLEYAAVHGNLYGTMRSEVERRVTAGHDVLLDIDVQGARQVRASSRDWPYGACVCYVFVGPPSVADLEVRLRGRGTDAEDVIQRRLANACAELATWREYDYLVVNDVIEDAVARLRAVVEARRSATVAIPASVDLYPELQRYATQENAR